MPTSIINKIVTKGFGAARAVANRAGPVAMGYGDTAVVTIEPEVLIRYGRSGEERRRKQEELRRIIARASLMSINEKAPARIIEGNQVVANPTDPNLTVRVKKINATKLFPHGIKIVVERLKKK